MGINAANGGERLWQYQRALLRYERAYRDAQRQAAGIHAAAAKLSLDPTLAPLAEAADVLPDPAAVRAALAELADARTAACTAWQRRPSSVGLLSPNEFAARLKEVDESWEPDEPPPVPPGATPAAGPQPPEPVE